jgi:hypothetical protein
MGFVDNVRGFSLGGQPYLCGDLTLLAKCSDSLTMSAIAPICAPASTVFQRAPQNSLRQTAYTAILHAVLAKSEIATCNTACLCIDRANGSLVAVLRYCYAAPLIPPSTPCIRACYSALLAALRLCSPYEKAWPKVESLSSTTRLPQG